MPPVPNAVPSFPATDRVLHAFLSRQGEEAAALARDSDLVTIEPLGGDPPVRYIVRFRCTGLVRTPDGSVAEADRFAVGISFPSDYLRRAEPAEVLTWLGPRNAFHPNISDTFPFICIGPVTPGTTLAELIYRCFDVVSGKRVTMDEHNALNIAACEWSRENRHRFPFDRRPLKRRTVKLNLSLAHDPETP